PGLSWRSRPSEEGYALRLLLPRSGGSVVFSPRGWRRHSSEQCRSAFPILHRLPIDKDPRPARPTTQGVANTGSKEGNGGLWVLARSTNGPFRGPREQLHCKPD